MTSLFKVGRSPIVIKALLGTGALVAACVVSLSGLFLLRHQTAFQRQFELRAESLASSLAGQTQFALLLANSGDLERISRAALAGNGDVLYVVIEDASGKTMATAERPPLSRRSLPEAPGRLAAHAIRNVR